MKGKRAVWIVIGGIAIAAAWYAFRPERLWVNEKVDEKLATASSIVPQEISMGAFHSVSHESMGTATVYRYADGNRVLRFTDFHTSNGPEVHVYLVAAADAQDNRTVTDAGFVDLGSIKGNVGDQNYTLPADIDLAKYRAVTIWCKRFGVNFATAPLSPSTQS